MVINKKNSVDESKESKESKELFYVDIYTS